MQGLAGAGHFLGYACQGAAAAVVAADRPGRAHRLKLGEGIGHTETKSSTAAHSGEWVATPEEGTCSTVSLYTPSKVTGKGKQGL